MALAMVIAWNDGITDDDVTIITVFMRLILIAIVIDLSILAWVIVKGG
jgi:hypothetical protein